MAEENAQVVKTQETEFFEEEFSKAASWLQASSDVRLYGAFWLLRNRFKEIQKSDWSVLKDALRDIVALNLMTTIMNADVNIAGVHDCTDEYRDILEAQIGIANMICNNDGKRRIPVYAEKSQFAIVLVVDELAKVGTINIWRLGRYNK